MKSLCLSLILATVAGTLSLNAAQQPLPLKETECITIAPAAKSFMASETQILALQNQQESLKKLIAMSPYFSTARNNFSKKLNEVTIQLDELQGRWVPVTKYKVAITSFIQRNAQTITIGTTLVVLGGIVAAAYLQGYTINDLQLPEQMSALCEKAVAYWNSFSFEKIVKNSKEMLGVGQASSENFVKRSAQYLGNSANYLSTKVTSYASQAKDLTSTGASKIATEITSGASKMSSSIVAGASYIGTGVTSGAAKIASGITSGTTSIVNGATAGFSNISSGIVSGLKNRLSGWWS